jgi:hypothetical protein
MEIGDLTDCSPNWSGDQMATQFDTVANAALDMMMILPLPYAPPPKNWRWRHCAFPRCIGDDRAVKLLTATRQA